MNLRCSSGGDSGFTLEDNDTISEISGHDEVVLDDEGRLLGVEDKPLDEQTVDSINEQR